MGIEVINHGVGGQDRVKGVTMIKAQCVQVAKCPHKTHYFVQIIYPNNQKRGKSFLIYRKRSSHLLTYLFH